MPAAFPSITSCRRRSGPGRSGASTRCAASSITSCVTCPSSSHGTRSAASTPITLAIPITTPWPSSGWMSAFSATSADGRTLIGLLPGSRTQEVERNFPMIVRAAGIIHQARPMYAFSSPLSRKPIASVRSRCCTAAAFQLRRSLVGRRRLSRFEAVHRCLRQRRPGDALARHAGGGGLPRPAAAARHHAPAHQGALHEPGQPHARQASLSASFPPIAAKAPPSPPACCTRLNDPAAFAEVQRELQGLKERVAQPGACARWQLSWLTICRRL